MWSCQPSSRIDYLRTKSPNSPSSNSKKSSQELRPSDSKKLTRESLCSSQERKLPDFRDLSRPGSTLRCTTELNKPSLTKLSTSHRGKSTRWTKDKSATKLPFKTRSPKLRKWDLRESRKCLEETMRTKWPNSHPLKSHRASISTSITWNIAKSVKSSSSSTSLTSCSSALKTTLWRKILPWWRNLNPKRLSKWTTRQDASNSRSSRLSKRPNCEILFEKTPH